MQPLRVFSAAEKNKNWLRQRCAVPLWWPAPAFTRCGELNLYGMVDAQIAALETELFDRQELRCVRECFWMRRVFKCRQQDE